MRHCYCSAAPGRPIPGYLGIGCRKGRSGAELSEFLQTVFQKFDLDKRRIARFASISLKEKEAGILELAFAERAPFLTFTAQELEAVPGKFEASGFVRKTVGVDNVCERRRFWEAAAEGSLCPGRRPGALP